jgi:hypothetical protein
MPDPINNNTRTALAAMTDAKLRAMQIADDGVPQIAPGVCAFLSDASDWELARHEGRDFAFNGPHPAIPSRGTRRQRGYDCRVDGKLRCESERALSREAVGQELDAPPPAVRWVQS